ncbi:MAG: energy transducer TonB [Rhodospirillaceae bacterium]|nr:energy transducer TonB [Rhodospirillaceae bacterium]
MATYDYAAQQRKPGKHVVGIGIVVLMHILLGWALVSGLARKVVEVIKNPIETKIIEETKPPPPPPENLPPPPKLAPPPPSFVPPPEVIVNPPPTPAPTITTTTVAPPPAPVTIAPAPTPAPPAPAPAPVAAQPAIGNVSDCRPAYPAAALRAQVAGTTTIRFTIDASGKMVSAEVVRSAGPSREHKLLDRTAVNALSGCSFRPGRDVNGQAVGASFPVEYVWKLE